MIDATSASQLRERLARQNREFARRFNLPHVTGTEGGSAIVYAPSERGDCHGNFISESYAAILGNAAWRKRLQKAHSSKKKLPKLEREIDRPWCELDSCTSSDALLMNIFCYPGLLQRREVASLLGLSLNPKTSGATIDFGFKARVPRINGSTDATEIDMRIDDLLIEAKLTESTFQQRDIVMVQRYRDFDVVFDRDALPRSKPRVKSVHDHDLGDILVTVPGERYESYQMIRNILAAYASQSRLCVLIDESRIDLREHYHAVLRTVRDAEVRTRCTLLTWQELSAELPAPLQQFLLGKYGIIR